MSKLYSTLAPIYHEMYQQIFDYDKEFRFYDSWLKKKNCRQVLEIGCGTGLLATRLIDAGYDYLGIDLYEEMLEIARKETKTDLFIRNDMRSLALERTFDCVMITGRSLAYVTTNPDLISTFGGIHSILKENGYLIFDAFDANKIFMEFKEQSEQFIETDSRKITRKNYLEKNLSTGWTWDFRAKYIVEENGGKSEYDDFSTLRAFTEDEIRLFMKLTGFETEQIIDDNVLVVIAKKIFDR